MSKSYSFSSPTYVEDRIWEVQPKPYVKPLPYFSFKRRGEGAGSLGTGHYLTGYLRNDWELPCGNDPRIFVTNRALDQFREKCFESSDFATSTAEARSSLSMITSRALQLTKATRSLRKLDLEGFVKALGVKKRTTRGNLRDFGGTWLEYSFGWAPLVSDIEQSMKVLAGDLPSGKVTASAKSQLHYDVKVQPFGAEIYHFFYDGSFIVKVGADVHVSDANMALANQLGFGNPVAIGWELVPFSFVVDWFSNVGDYLSWFNPFMGFSVTSSYHTQYCRYSEKFSSTYNGDTQVLLDASAGHLVRSLGLPSYALAPMSIEKVSVTRAANAISLLLQFLRR